MGDSSFSGFCHHFSLFPLYGMSADRLIDRSLLLGKIVVHNGAVRSVYRVRPKLLGQNEMRVVIFAYDERTGRIFVDPVDDTRTQDAIDTG